MLRIMIVEDEFLLAEMLVDEVRRLGYQVIGPFGLMAAALDAARSLPLDAALLDVQIRNDVIYPLADVLHDRAIPYAFVTSSDLSQAPDRHRAAPAARKPVSKQTVAALLVRLTEAPQAR